jgi:hypothetical protein
MSDERCSLKFNASLLFVIVNRNCQSKHTVDRLNPQPA